MFGWEIFINSDYYSTKSDAAAAAHWKDSKKKKMISNLLLQNNFGVKVSELYVTK